MSLATDMSRLCDEIKAGRSLRQDLRQHLQAESQQRCRTVHQQLADIGQRRQESAAADHGRLQRWHGDLSQAIRTSLGGWSTARREQAAAAAAARRQGCSDRRQAVSRNMATWQQDRAGAQAALANLGHDLPAPAAMAEAQKPAAALATGHQNLAETLYLLVNSHPEGLSVLDAEHILALPRVLVGQTLRRLVDAGRVRRDGGLYFTDNGDR